MHSESKEAGSKKYILPFLAIVAITVSVYANSLFNGFVLDDKFIIADNQATRQPGNIREVLLAPDVVKPYYRPLNRASYLIDYQLFGMNPFWFHAVNILIHTAGALLLYLVAFRLTADRYSALVAALLFSVHPVNSEAVNFISARNGLLAFCFSLASWHAFMKGQEKRFPWLFLSALLFFCALLSKETGLMLIAVIALYELFPSGGSVRNTWRERLFTLSFYAPPLVLYFAMRSYSLGGALGAGVPAEGLVSRLAMNYHIIPQYISLLLFPADLTIFHEVPKSNLLTPLWHLPVWAALIAAAWLVIRGRHKAAIFGLAWIVINYVPVSGIVPIPSDEMTERFLYMPAAGFFIIIGTVVGQYFRQHAKKAIAGAVILVLCAVVTIHRNRDWKDDYSLFLSGVRNNPASASAHYNLGTALLEDSGDLEAARREWETSLRIDPLNSDALIQMGTYQARKGDLQKAEQLYMRALLAPPGKADPDKAMAYLNLGKIHEKQQRPGNALREYELFLKFVNLRYAEYSSFAQQRVAYLQADFSGSRN